MFYVRYLNQSINTFGLIYMQIYVCLVLIYLHNTVLRQTVK